MMSVSATFATEGEDVELGDEDEKGAATKSPLGPVHTETVVALPGNVVSTRTTLPMRPSVSRTMRLSFISWWM